MGKPNTAGERFFFRAVKLLQFEAKAETMSQGMQDTLREMIERIDVACKQVLEEYDMALETCDKKSIRKSWTQIGGRQPDHYRDWECQCARCGSTLDFEPCTRCGGQGYLENGQDEDGQWEDDDRCEECLGRATFPVCMSGDEYCQANPIKGRESIQRNTPEWFTFDPPKKSENG